MFSFFIPGPYLLAGLLAVLLVFVAAEVYLRARYDSVLRIRVYPQVYVPDEDLGYRYRPHAEGEIRIPGIHRRFRINNRGFHARDYVDAKTPGVYRIAIVGTSNTTGIWMDGEGKNFSELLEEMLRAEGHQVEVMNFGIDGRFRAVHELRIIHTDVAAYNPDLVLIDVDIPFIYGSFKRDVYKGYVMIYNSETELSRKWCEEQIDYVTRRKLLIALYRASYVIRTAARLYLNKYDTPRANTLRVFVENRIQAPDIVLLPLSLKKSVEALQAARFRLAQQGGELAIFQYSANYYYRQITAKYGLPYLEINVPPIPQFVHDHDGHYSEEGHVEVARQLFDQLVRSGVLDGRRGAVAPQVLEHAHTA